MSAKQPVRLFSLWAETINALTHEGLLLNSIGRDGQLNTMTIGWLTGGSIWGKPILTVLVRPSRYTFSRLEEVAEFTVNVLPPELRAAAEICGTESGRKVNKFARTQLTPVAAQKISVPVIDQAVINYECRVVHRNDIIPANLARDIVASAYGSGDFHRVYFGEVLAAYATTDARTRLQNSLI